MEFCASSIGEGRKRVAYTYIENWSQLPEDLIGDIANRLLGHEISDFVRFGAVCRSWRFVTTQKHYFSGVRQLPWLMIPEENDESGDNGDIRSFVSLSTKRVYNVELPEARGRRCWGSQFGWLITVGIDSDFRLLNPLTHVEISLPKLDSFQDHFPFRNSKAILSSDPETNSECIVMLVITFTTESQPFSQLAITRVGDTSWMKLRSSLGGYSDVIFFNGRFYAALCKGGIILVVDVNNTNVSLKYLTSITDEESYNERFYFVEMGQELHVVWNSDRLISDGCGRSHLDDYFEVHKINVETREWVELSSFDDYALVVSASSSLSLSTLDYPGLKGNCIYFKDEDQRGCSDRNSRCMGIFDYEGRGILNANWLSLGVKT
ncbi:hypothetical protein GIB67_000045 [Kingdonia uniflora]|uniref:KIB1-4 beta-propeller domain-containing protein n=1 Tax=Kingdonia uniflora TaxID=39325 RepID=A0A7J7L0B4_9MAGN|nr:hypothetical protein GIB67_000045 [Kingdonia uniflora]